MKRELNSYAHSIEAQLNELELPTEADLTEDQIEILLSYEGGE